MVDRLASRTPYLGAVLRALIDPERTEFEIRHLDLGRARSVWLAELRREIAGLSARASTELDQIRALCVAAGWEDEGSTLGLVTGVVELLTLTTRSKSPCGHWAAHAYSPDGKGKQIKCLDCEVAVLTERAACADQPWQPLSSAPKMERVLVVFQRGSLGFGCLVKDENDHDIWTDDDTGEAIGPIGWLPLSALPAPPSPAKETP